MRPFTGEYGPFVEFGAITQSETAQEIAAIQCQRLCKTLGAHDTVFDMTMGMLVAGHQ